MGTRVGYLIVILTVIVSCNSDENIDGSAGDEAAVTEIGAPIGPPATADIGPSGGVITSADNKLTITVPPDAVVANTAFSIVPIEDFCPGGIGSYRLLPEGMTFAKPVTITFHYDEEDLEGTLSEFLDIAYQETDRKWYALSWVSLDEQARNISAEVMHFTNWSAASKLRIEPRNPSIPVVEKGATYNLHVAGAKDSPPKIIPAGPGEVDDLPMLPRKKQVPFTATWYVNSVPNGNSNVGTISTDNKTHVTYHAPNNVPANNPVLVTAELTDFEAWDRDKKEIVKLNKVICMKRIRIKPEEYNFTLEIDFKFEDACGLPGVIYHDHATLDVQVKDEGGQETVTFNGILNEDATTKPAEIRQGDCTLSCRTGGPGLMNVSSASGVASFDDDQLDIIVSHTGTSPAAIGLACPDRAVQTTPVAFQPYLWQFRFRLSDEGEQTTTTQVFTAKLTPK